MRVYTSKNEPLSLSDTAMSSGGEGELHTILFKPASFAGKDICVKIYFKSKRSRQLEQKLLFMVANPPQNIQSEGSMLAWPLDVVYNEKREFLGFVMPLAFANSKPLIYLTEKKISRKLDPIWKDKYDRSLGAYSMIARLKLICNIAIPIHKLHATNRYVLRDFKPENVLVTPEGKVTLVDMDSVQITDTNGTGKPMFHDFSATPNYMPPEHYTRGVGKDPNVAVGKSWDYFSLGVVFYQIVFGLHPYVVNPLYTRDNSSNEIYQNVAQNLFLFGPNASKISSYPPLHDNFKHTPPQLQSLFKGAFSSDPSARPTLEQWVKTLKEVISKAPTPPPPAFGTISINIRCTGNVSIWIDDRYYRSIYGPAQLDLKATEGRHKVYVTTCGNPQDVWIQKGGQQYLVFDSLQVTLKGDVNSKTTTPNKSGCIWGIIIAIICGVGIIIGINVNKGNDDFLSEEIVEVDSVQIDPVELLADNTAMDNASYLRVSDNHVSFDADGGNVKIEIETDGEWEISTGTADWGHLTKHASSVTLSVDPSSENEDRTDWFEIKAGNIEKRIDITQHTSHKQSANIERVWVDHNEYVNGEKGMLIHSEISVDYLEGKTIYVYAYFYQEDNTTPLHNTHGNDLYFYRSGNVNIEHKSGRFNDFQIFVPYTGLNMASGTSGNFSFDIAVKYNGEQLDRNTNNSFTFSNVG